MFHLEKYLMFMYMKLLARNVIQIIHSSSLAKLILIYFLIVFLVCFPCWNQSMAWLNCTKKNVFVCDCVATIKICQGQLYFHYSNPKTMYIYVKCFQRILRLGYKYKIVHMKWKPSPLDLSTPCVGYLCFDFSSYTFWVHF